MTTVALTHSLDRPNRPSARTGLVVGLLAAIIACTYTLRGTIIAYTASESLANYIALSEYAAIVAAALYLAWRGFGGITYGGIVVLAATGASLIGCERFDFALWRWMGWALMFWCVGPLSTSQTHRELRGILARHVERLFLFITIASFSWWLLGIPNMGRGVYLTGVMWHSMVLAPITALAAVSALSKAISKNSQVWYGVFAVSVLTCTLASSRAALAGLGAAVIAILVTRMKRSPLTAVVAAIPVAAFAAYAAFAILQGGGGDDGSLTSGLSRKSWVHSRENHWRDRWEEFAASPYRGVGFASSREGTAGYDAESGAVETGSSYLSILSMTGAGGMIAFGLLCVNLIQGVRRRWHRLSPETRLSLCGISVFWLVHLGAEGYIYAVGSLMGLSFWLWMGMVSDLIASVDISASHRRSVLNKDLTAAKTPFRRQMVSSASRRAA